MPPQELTYESDGHVLRFSLFPSSRARAGLIVLVHGGGWISGSRQEMWEVASELADEQWACACMDYRLAPLHQFPAAVRDVRAMIRHARRNAEALGVDPNRIVALGNSAGGHLSLMSGVADEREDGVSSQANAVVAICPITDVTDPQAKHFPIAWSFLTQFLGNLSDENMAETLRAASPVSLCGALNAPTMLAHGEADDIVPCEQSREMARVLGSHKVPHRLLTLPGEGHGFSYGGFGLVLDWARQFLEETFA